MNRVFGAPHFHAGIDIADSAGTPILAVDDGVVVAAQDGVLIELARYGRHVVIAHHNGMLTLYSHLEAYSVKVGDRVHQGDLIGAMGSTGKSTGPHLHFELRISGVPTDPRPYFPADGPNSFRE